MKMNFSLQGDFQGLQISENVELPEEDRLKAIANLEAWSQPLDKNNTIGLLSELRLTTNSKKLSQDDVIIQTKVYAKKLQKYPASVVAHVLETQPDVSKWWPEWADLKERLDVYTRKNQAALNALREYKKPEALPKPKQEKDLKRVDELMKAFHAKMSDELE